MGVRAHAENGGGQQSRPQQPAGQDEASPEASGVRGRDPGSQQDHQLRAAGESRRGRIESDRGMGSEIRW